MAMNDEEIRVAITAQTEQYNAAMAQAADDTEAMRVKVAAEAQAFNAAQQAKYDALMRLNAAFGSGITSAEAVAEAERALDQAMSAGAITASEYAGYVERLNAAELQMSAAMEASTAATTENTAALAMNGGVAREVGVLIGELARGNYTRLEGSTITLANRTGLLTSAFEFLISPLGIATEAAAALGIAAYQAAQDEEALRTAIINSGDASGYNADQLRTMENELVSTGATAAQAKEAVLAVAGAGNILGQNFKNAAQAAVDMSQLTGISIDKAVAAIGKLQEDPVKSIMKLNDTMNFLTPTEAAEIKHLQDIGDKAGAAALAISTLTNAEEARVKAQRDAGDGAESFIGKLQADASSLWAGTKNLFSPATLKQQLDDANKEIAAYASQNPGSIHQDDQNRIIVDKSKLSDYQFQELNKLLERRKEIEAQITAEDERQERISAKIAANKEAVNKTLAAKTPKHHHGDHQQAQADLDAFDAQRLQHTMSLADERKFWEEKKQAATEGTQAYRQAVQQLLEIRSKEATAAREASRREVADAKHAAAERVRAEKEVEREKEQAAKKAEELSQAKLRASYDASMRDIANQRQQYELEFSEGTINAQRLLELERQLTTRKLEIDKDYYQKKAALDAGDPIAVVRDDSAIVKAQQKAQSEMMRAESEFHSNSEKAWTAYTQRIEGAMQSAINAMIFQHQTMQKELANIGMVIGEDFIQQAVMKPLDAWLSAEATKLAATISTVTGQTTAQETSRATNAAADAAASVASITRAAGVAGAQGVASFSGAPWPVDMGAPAFGASMSLMALSYGSLASAAGGWERVPVDGAPAILHKDEQVLPASYAEGLRKLVANGGSGQAVHHHHHYNIQAWDGRSMKDTLRRNPHLLADAATHARRNGF